MKKSLLVVSLLAVMGTAPAFANDLAERFSVNVGAIAVMPDDSSSSLPVIESVAGLASGTTGVTVDDNTQLGITIDYRIDKNWTLELVAATPFSHEIHGTGALAGLKVGETKHLPPSLFAQYHFDMGNSAIDPFIGVGVNYTTFFEEKVDNQLVGTLETLGVITTSDHVELALSNSWGFALQAGVNFKLSENWGLHAMVSTMAIDTQADVRINGVTVETVQVDIDPTVAMLGLRYSF